MTPASRRALRARLANTPATQEWVGVPRRDLVAMLDALDTQATPASPPTHFDLEQGLRERLALWRVTSTAEGLDEVVRRVMERGVAPDTKTLDNVRGT